MLPLFIVLSIRKLSGHSAAKPDSKPGFLCASRAQVIAITYCAPSDQEASRVTYIMEKEEWPLSSLRNGRSTGGVEGIVSNRKCVVRIPRVPVSLLSQQGCMGFTELWFSIQIT